MKGIIKAASVSTAIAVFALGLALGCQTQNTNAMAEARAKTYVGKVMQLWNEGNMDVADEIYNADVVRHDFALNQDFTGVEAQKKLIEQNRTAFPDLKLAATEIVVEGDSLALMWSFTGTNTGPMGDFPATGKPIEFKGLSMVHLMDGRASEMWDFYNQLDILQQLGYTVAPPSEATEQ